MNTFTKKNIFAKNVTWPMCWLKLKRNCDLFFKKGEISIQNGAVEKPSARLAAGFEELAAISSGQLGPIWALLTGKIKAGGNLIKLLMMARAIISKEKQ